MSLESTHSTYCLSKFYNHPLKTLPAGSSQTVLSQGKIRASDRKEVLFRQYYGKNCASTVFYLNCEF